MAKSAMSKSRIKRNPLKTKLALSWLSNMRNFENAILISRRQSQQRLVRQREALRHFYMKQFLGLERSLLKMLTLPGFEELFTEDCVESKKLQAFHTVGAGGGGGGLDYAQMQSFENILFTEYTSEQWLNTFHFSRRAFHWLYTQLYDDLQGFAGFECSSVEKLMTLSLYALTTGANKNVIANLFQIKNSHDVHQFLSIFTNAILMKLSQSLLAMPQTEEEFAEISDNLCRISRIPAACVGVLGVYRIGVSQTIANAYTGYEPRQTTKSFVLQAIVDDKMLFRSVQLDGGKPKMLTSSPNVITKLKPRLIDGRQFPCFVVSPTHDYYSFKPWLMQKYRSPQAQHEVQLNCAVNYLQRIKHEAFKRLFARFGILHTKIDCSIAKNVVLACCVLHNLLEENDSFNNEWSQKQPNIEQYRINFDQFEKRLT